MRKRALSVLAGLLTLGLPLAGTAGSAAAAATPGSLDTTFGTGGEVVTGLNTSNTSVNGVAEQSNGDIVVGINFGAARFLPSGSLDRTFGTGGIVQAQPSFDAGAMTLQSDGKIVVVGNVENPPGSPNGTFNIVVDRFTSSGSLDSGFGTGGVVTTAFPGETAIEDATSVLQQPDGKLLVGGEVTTTGKTSPILGALARFNPDGSLDSTFGNGGRATFRSSTTILGQSTSVARTLGLDPAGDIFVSPAQLEFSPSGQQDANVTPAAITASSHGGLGIGFGGAYLASSQSVLGEALTVVKGDLDAQVQRFNADGTLDTTFSNPPFDYGGQEGSGRDGITAVAIQSSGQTVVAGSHFAPFGTAGASLARINTNGSLDAGFGSSGTVTTAFPGLSSGYSAVVIQSDGKIVAVGAAGDPTTGFTDLTLARYLSQ